MSLLNNFTKHKFIDSWVNLKSNIKNRFWSKSFKGEVREINPSKDYSIVFEDNFKGPLDLNDWRYAMPWGDFHPGALHQYYDNNGTLSYVSPEGLVLELRKIPKKIIKRELPDWRQTDKMSDEFVIPVGVGFVSTKKSWKYGWFESSIKLPKGKSYWNAFWLCGEDTWPPEIDIFEGYSDEGPEYQSGKSKNRKIQPNLHYGVVEDGTKKMYSPFNNTIADATERFVQYVCHWEEGFIKIYYDGKLVFQCTDPKILSWYNKPNSQQFLILNHGLHEHKTENPDESAMIIKNVKVYQKKMKLINVLSEATGRKYEYGCAMLYFDFPQINEIHDLIDSEDIYTEEGDSTYGLEKEPHTTLLFGLHDGVSTEDVSKVLGKFKYGECKIHNPSLFENENYDVLKFDVKGPNLHETNALLRKFPHTNNFPDYHPHLTIAYIKPGMGKKYVEMLKGQEHSLIPKVAVYSKPDGSKDEIGL